MIRNYLPFLPNIQRSFYDLYQFALNGNKKTQPNWHQCASLLSQWMPFAIRAFQQKPELINVCLNKKKYIIKINLTLILTLLTHDQDNNTKTNTNSHSSSTNCANYDNEIVKIIFSNIKTALIKSINDAAWLNSRVTQYTVDKLANTRLQIGIPDDILESTNYLNNYYDKYFIQAFFFADQPLSQWSFEKDKMQQRLSLVNESDR